MAATPSIAAGHHGLPARSRQVLTATAPVFAPADIEANKDVRDATFITHTVPDISPNAGIIGLCTVPAKRAGMNDLGWHLADFLAWKALLCGETHPQAQTWMALCDVAGIVNANPEQYAHGKDRRLVSGAALASTYTDRDGNTQQRGDDIKVQPSAQKLQLDFILALSEKSKVARAGGYPLVVIVCGPTTVEQDVFFGKIDETHHFGCPLMRHILHDSIDATVITPALFSAGWQVNPFFCRKPAGKVVADRTELLAKQFGGVFALAHVKQFLGWKCPLLDFDRANEKERGIGFPGPVMPTEEQKQTHDALKIKLHAALAGRLSSGHGDHSFAFGDENDDWETMVGARQYKPLSYYHRKWTSLGQGAAVAMDREKFVFLGNAFGGSQMSQFNHIKDLVKESFVGSPGYWKMPLGRNAKIAFKAFLGQQTPDTPLCHEIFNVMEHRATLAVVGDRIVECFDLCRPYEKRCRDWDESRSTVGAPDVMRTAVTQTYGELTQCIPGVDVPPGVNVNNLSPVQNTLQHPIAYVSTSVCLRHLTRSADFRKEVAKRISQFFEGIKERQLELLLKDSEVQEMCTTWLRSIGMPIRTLGGGSADVELVKEPEQADGNKSTSHTAKPSTEAGDVTDVDDPSEPPAETGASTPQNAQAGQAEPSENLPNEAKVILSGINHDMAIELLSKEKESLINELVRAPPDDLVAIQERLANVQRFLNSVQEEKTKDKARPAPSSGPQRAYNAGSEEAEQAPSKPAVTQKPVATSKPVAAPKSVTTAKPDEWMPPHLRHTAKKAVKPTKESKPDEGSFRLSNSPMQSAPARSPEMGSSSFAPRTPQEENKAPEQWVPPHLRRLPVTKPAGRKA
ncbi:hypothetical protein F5Y06DRAFT_303941 [Hypoxylon sp. FL0890]|nr:hypothetical protein F5Y06DRAFT_303941 [Hypoxylon sp. FL0890]